LAAYDFGEGSLPGLERNRSEPKEEAVVKTIGDAVMADISGRQNRAMAACAEKCEKRCRNLKGRLAA